MSPFDLRDRRISFHHASPLQQVFTSRNGKQAIAEIVTQSSPGSPQLNSPFLIAALLRDVKEFPTLGKLREHPRRQIIIPKIAIPQTFSGQLREESFKNVRAYYCCS